MGGCMLCTARKVCFVSEGVLCRKLEWEGWKEFG